MCDITVHLFRLNLIDACVDNEEGKVICVEKFWYKKVGGLEQQKTVNKTFRFILIDRSVRL